jgi:hypothetical protein
MRDEHDLLEQAMARGPRPDFTLSDLEGRRERRQRRKRVEAGVLGLTVGVMVLVGALLALRHEPTRVAGDGSAGDLQSGDLPPATVAQLVAEPGQYYYWSIRLVGGCYPGQEQVCGGTDVHLDVTYWWSSDDSGRIEVDERRNYGIEEGRFEAGAFPNNNGIDVSSFPLETGLLTQFLLDRSAEGGSSPAPLVTPPPDGAPRDGQMWRAITDLLADPHVTPTVRAALLDVAAGLHGSHVTTDVVDPVGRPAHVIEFGNWGGELAERLYLDPTTHELLAWTKTASTGDEPFEYFVVQGAGVVDSTEVAPSEEEGSIPWPAQPVPFVPTHGDPYPESCSQGGSDLRLWIADGVFDTDCLVVEAGSPFTIELHAQDAGVADNVSIYRDSSGTEDPLFVGEIVTGPDTVTYEVPPLDPGTYVFRSDVHPQMNGTLFVA